MRKKLQVHQVASSSSDRKMGWVRWVISAVIILAVGGFVYSDYKKSQVAGSPYRYNLVLAEESGEVAFVSFDPEEKQVFAIPYPKNLEIKSRSVGTYRIENLYKLGSYEGSPGLFVKRKVQGFMRVPVAGYLETQANGSLKQGLTRGVAKAIWDTSGTSLSKLDAIILLQRLNAYEWREASNEELVRAGVIKQGGESYQYSHERLKQYLGARVFDWSVGESNITVAVINGSGEDGLGNDIAEFLSNLGFDVVAVKGLAGDEKREQTTLIYSLRERGKVESVLLLFAELFGWQEAASGSTDEYRADLIVTLGTDAEDLF